MRKMLLEKMKESALAVAPISMIVLALHATGLAPLPGWTLGGMLMGAFMLFLGMVLFSIGVENAMMPIGQHVGSSLISSRKLLLIVGVLFLFGFVVTMAEPDLTVFANQVASVPSSTLLVGISLGVGVFLVVAVLRVIFHWKVSRIMLIGYPLAFLIAIFSSDYIAVAVDAAAITTGPITVPFLLAIGSGFAAVSSRKDADEDNFGVSGICSVGPIMSVLILGLFFDASGTQYQPAQPAILDSARALFRLFGNGLWHSLTEVLLILAPILGVFLIFQVVKLKLARSEMIRILVGLGFLLVGMTIFLTGVNKGFLPAAKALGEAMGQLPHNWVLIPVSFIIGASVVLAEPTVYVLTNQVEEITHGGISRRVLLCAMALSVSIAMALSVARILYSISIWWILLPGYAVSLTLSLFTPNMFAGIGFDSGGVVTGAMSAAFVIPFAIGICAVIPGRNIVADAFGTVGVLAMIPPIIIQLIGLLYSRQLKRAQRQDAQAVEHSAQAAESD